MGYVTVPVVVEVKADSAGEAYDIGREILHEGQGSELESSFTDEFIVYDEDGDEVPEHELYELGD